MGSRNLVRAKSRDKMTKENMRKIIVFSAISLLITGIVTFALSTAAWKVKSDAGVGRNWGFAESTTIASFASAIGVVAVVLTQEGKPTMKNVVRDSLVATFWFGQYIGQMAPSYVQTGMWNGARTSWMQLEVAAMIFAGFGLMQSFSLANMILSQLEVQSKVAPATDS